VKKEKTKDKQMDSALSIKLPLELREKAAAKSKKTGIALSFVIRKALEDWLKEDEK
jgi:predicted DNA-binding protein